jgi:hypothetical protein
MSETRVKLNNVRITFPKLFEGQAEQFNNKGDAYYSASFLLSADHPDMPKLKAAIRAAATAKYGAKADDMLKEFQIKDKLPVHDGALKAAKPYGAAYKGLFYVSARNNAKTNPPVSVFDNVIDPATNAARSITSQADKHAPYSGCMVNAILNVFAYNRDGGQGVGASIVGVQFHADGERLAGGSVASADDFEAIVPPKNEAAETKGAASLF